MPTFIERLRAIAKISRSHIYFDGKGRSYSTLVDDVAAASRSLRRNSPASQIVFWYGRDSYALLCLLLACLENKKILLPAGAKKVFRFAAEHVPFGSVYHNTICTHQFSGPNDFAGDGGLLISTSGTTSNVKYAHLSEKMILSNGDASQKLQGLAPSDNLVLHSRLTHTGGWNIHLLPGLLAGSNIYFFGAASPYTMIKNFGRFKSFKTHLSPAQIQLLAAAKQWPTLNFNNMALCVTGSSEVRPHLIRSLLNKGANCVMRNYGLTEAGPVVFSKSTTSEFDELESLGELSENFTARVDKDHHLHLAGDALFSGYFCDREYKSRVTKFFDTGDLILKSSGRFYFGGRAEHLIKINQKIISPSIVEGQISKTFDEVTDCCLVPAGPSRLQLYCCGDRIRSAQIKKLIARETNTTSVEIKHIRFLPRNLNGKVDRKLLLLATAEPVGESLIDAQL